MSSMGFGLVLYSMPEFWLGILLLILFAVTLGIFPTGGFESVSGELGGLGRITDVANHMFLPCLTLTLAYLGEYYLLMRSSLLDVQGEDYVTTARAKGLTEHRIRFKHIFRNAVLPVVTMAGVQIGSLLGGSVVVESVFGWPGLGLLTFQALFARDLNLILGIFFMSACLVVVVNLMVDLFYTFLDPRIELQ